MEIKDQVINLELSQEMEELGAEQDSLFSWMVYKNKPSHMELTKWARNDYGGIGIKDRELYAAFTVAELGEMLPTFYTSWHTAGTWACGDEVVKRGGKVTMAKTEADARAKMWIYLKKEGMIE